MEWHSLGIEEVLKKFDVSKKNGLNAKEVNARLSKYGENKILEKKNKSIIIKFLEQFKDFMVIILLIAAVISFLTSIFENSSDYIDSVIILFIVVLNAIIGVIQENKAEKAIDALKKLSAPHARLIRGGKEIHTDSKNVVPGDILLLDTGDFICADARLIESYNLKTEESALTGESLPSEKNSDLILSSNKGIGDRKNMVFSSSVVISGHAVAVVVATGMDTQVGKIATMINQEDSPQTPLQKKLAQTSKILGIGAIIICIGIFFLGLMQNTNPLEMFMISISLAVAAIPEGLPAVVTIVLAMGVKRMAINRAIIRKLPAVETLGSATVICSDKTGTLTQNKMTVKKLSNVNNYVDFSSDEGLNILTMASLCNNSSLTGDFGHWKASGEPTEKAIVLAAAKSGKVKSAIDNQFPRVGEAPFDSKRKLMSTIHKLGENRYRIITKGAPDVLISHCISYSSNGTVGKLDYKTTRAIEKQNKEMAENALRVLAVAYRDIPYQPTSAKDMEKELCFCGLIGMIDPPRPQVKHAVAECINAGIKPAMITGDHIITASAIAKELGILRNGDLAITGNEIEKMSQEDLEKRIHSYSVFARVSPEHKVRIVKAFQKNGEIVAMTGDGVNDAPALKSADIGCAMGRSGTDVAKEASDMILTDDNFATIIHAVKQGRGIFENIKKTIHFLLSTNIGEIITVLVAFLMGIPTPLLAIQLLWVNLVTDSFPALALGVEPIDPDIMKQKPVKSKNSILSGGMGYNICVEGCFIGVISLLAFVIGIKFFDTTANPIIGRTMAFCVLSLSQIVHAFNVRSEKSFFKYGLLRNPHMSISFIVCLILQLSVVSIPSIANVFKTIPLNFTQWTVVSLLSVSILVLVEIEKYIVRLKNLIKNQSNA